MYAIRSYYDQQRGLTRFYACFALSLWAATGMALAGNLLTLFVCYELLTLATWPLVTHAGTPEAHRSGRLYLGLLLGTSISLLLLAIIWTWQIAGTLDFVEGGFLRITSYNVCYTKLLRKRWPASAIPAHRRSPQRRG